MIHSVSPAQVEHKCSENLHQSIGAAEKPNATQRPLLARKQPWRVSQSTSLARPDDQIVPAKKQILRSSASVAFPYKSDNGSIPLV